MSESQYTDGSYLARNPTWHVEDSAWKAEQILKILRRNQINPATVCEIGCGAGAVLENVARGLDSSCRLTGFDIAPEAIEMTRPRETKNVHFELGDLLTRSDVSFDVVLCIDVFEHIEDSFGFLRRLRDKGRWKVFHIPLEISVERVLLNRFLESRRQYGHVHVYSRDTALELLRECGYRVVDWFYAPSAFSLPAHRLGNRLARIPRRILYAISPDFCSRLLGGLSLMALAE